MKMNWIMDLPTNISQDNAENSYESQIVFMPHTVLFVWLGFSDIPNFSETFSSRGTQLSNTKDTLIYRRPLLGCEGLVQNSKLELPLWVQYMTSFTCSQTANPSTNTKV